MRKNKVALSRINSPLRSDLKAIISDFIISAFFGLEFPQNDSTIIRVKNSCIKNPDNHMINPQIKP